MITKYQMMSWITKGCRISERQGMKNSKGAKLKVRFIDISKIRWRRGSTSKKWKEISKSFYQIRQGRTP